MPDQAIPAIAAREVYTPSALTRFVRDLLEDVLPLIWIEGEISNFSRPASGHLYFTLKDAGAQVRCAMFKPKSTWLRFKPTDGQHVLARARVGLYEARGEFQLVIDSLEEVGEGALQRAFEHLKVKLAAEGLFEAALKRPLPKWPQRIGIITSPTGAAIRDVLSVIARRFPLAQIDILPVPVQGKEAPLAIVAMLQAASKTRRHDVLLLTRGGGSLEDLWAFNDEAVARAIRASTIPVVSAIGHEIDFTIADFVADLRAPTPSAAAELLVPDAGELTRLFARQRRLVERTNVGIERRDARVALIHTRLLAQHPATLLARRIENTQTLGERLRSTSTRDIERRAGHLGELARTLNAVSPLATLQRGYAIVFDRTSGNVVRSVAQVQPLQTLRARLADGEIGLSVDES